MKNKLFYSKYIYIIYNNYILITVYEILHYKINNYRKRRRYLFVYSIQILFDNKMIFTQQLIYASTIASTNKQLNSSLELKNKLDYAFGKIITIYV